MYFRQPVKKMSQSQLRKAMAEQTYNENSKDEHIQEGLIRNYNLDVQNQHDDYVSLQEQNALERNKRNKFVSNLKNSLVSECIYKLYKDSCTVPLTESNTIIVKNLINKFVIENGAQNLINKFETKNLMLSEFSRICNKYYDKFIHESSEENNDEDDRYHKFTIDPESKDGFYKELQNVDTDDAAELIRTRVSDSISDFIDTNMLNKLQYEEIIKDAQDKIYASKNESFAEEYSRIAKRKINEMKLKETKNVFHCMVESLCENVIKDDKLKTKYMDGASLNMDKIVEHAELIYTMLELVNTSEMINVNESVISSYLKSL